jgi:hypothetical protein
VSVRYQRVFTRIWDDERVRRLSPLAQRAFIYLITNQATNMVGLYLLKEGYVCEDLQCSPAEFSAWFAEVIRERLVSFDEGAKLVLIHAQLKHAPLTNRNQVKSAVKLFESLPNSPVLGIFVDILNTSEVLSKGLNKELAEVLRSTGVGFKTLEPKNQEPKTLKPESTNLEQSTSSRRPCFSTEGSEEEKQPSPSPSSPKGDDEKKGDGFLAQVSRLHFRLFGYALKPLELKTLEGYPQASVLAKYEEALSRRGSRQEVKFFSWIEAGLKGGGEKPGLLKRLFGGADEDRARGYRVDVG